jgi:hypothetical protein
MADYNIVMALGVLIFVIFVVELHARKLIKGGVWPKH